MRPQRTSWLLWSVVAAVPVLGLPAISLGQVANQVSQPNNTGHANDANNQVGSGGTNGTRNSGLPAYTGNQVVNGNVSGLFGFHGSGPNQDPRAFQGTVPSGEQIINTFYGQSSGVPTNGQGTAVPNQATPFYPDSRQVPPPVGYGKMTPGAYGYVPIVPTNDMSTAYHYGSLATDSLSPISPKLNQSLLPPGVDSSGNPIINSASPLYGIRPITINNTPDQEILKSMLQSGLTPTGLDAQTVQRLRQEINQSGLQPGMNPGQNTPNPASSPGTNGNGTPQAPALNGSQSSYTQPIGPSREAPSNAAITNTLTSSQVASTKIDNSVRPQADNQLVPPEQQSSQYLEMKQRLQQLENPHNLTPAQLATMRSNTLAKVSQPAPGPAIPLPPTTNPAAIPAHTTDTVTPGGQGGDVLTTLQQNAEAPVKPDPVEIKSLASGVSAKGLSAFLAKAEALMKDGKYTSAVDTYETAQQIAPNNPLITIGRANAELGAGLFSQADRHLRDALGQDSALLMARYDLSAFIGEDRLGTVIKELKAISQKDDSPQPMFLLAYIAYNTNHAREAQGYLTLADQRSGGKDPLYQIIRDHWKLPAPATTSESPNK